MISIDMFGGSTSENKSIMKMWKAGLLFVIFFLLNKYINLISPIHVIVIAGLFSFIGILMAGLGKSKSTYFCGEDSYFLTGGWCLIIGIVIFAIEFFVPYNIAFAFTGYSLPASARAFFAQLAERMVIGLGIFIGFCFSVFAAWAYCDLLKSYCSRPPVTGHNELKRENETKLSDRDDDYIRIR
jgi:hypothetical protein